MTTCVLSAPPRWHAQLMALLAVVVLVGGAMYDADAQQVVPIYEGEPFDLLTLKPEQKSEPLPIYPLENRDRAQRVNPKPDDLVRIRLLSHPDRLFDVAWKDIERLEFFDELVLKEAIRLVGKGEFDSAFHHFAFLLNESPDLPGLQEAIERFLFTDASASFRAGQLHESLAILEELYRLDPQRPGAQQGIQRVTRQLFRFYMDKKEYRSAQRTIVWAAERFGRESLGATLSSWEQELSNLAQERMEQARAFVKQGNLQDAYQASNEMMAIWPGLEGAAALSQSIAQRYPVVHVGVTSGAGRLDPRRFEDWAARRAGRLGQRLLVENNGYGTEGGLYFSPFATLRRSDDGLSLMLDLRDDLKQGDNPAISGHAVASRLLQLGDPAAADFSPVWRELIDSVYVENVFNLHADLKRFFLRPEALLQMPFGDVVDDAEVTATQPYRVLERSDKVLRSVLNRDYCLSKATQPREVVEHLYSESSLALQGLRNGDVDIIDRIYPGDVPRLRSEQGMTMDTYSVPSLHMLVPNYQRPYTSSRTFRRALEYGINRSTLLREDILGKAELEGCRLLSGPLPAGRSADDALAYAYDASIEPRPYEPRLSVTLAAVAKSELRKAAEKSGETPPEMSSLMLVYPDSEIARVACAGISQYLSAVGIACTAQPLPVGETWPADNQNWDLLYLEVVMAEPAVDIRRLLGANGVVRGGSPYLEAALIRLGTATNWAEARTQLNEIHRLAYEEVAVVPLWQLVDHFAYRQTLRGIAAQPISLYESIEDWQLDTTRSAEVR